MPLLGNQPWQVRAARCIPILLELAINRGHITYGQLVKRLGMNNPRHAVKILSLASEVIDEYYHHEAPDICVLVVSASTRIPGDGFMASAPASSRAITHNALSKAAYFALPLAEKRVIIEELKEEVFAFTRWPELLRLARDYVKYYI